MTCAIVADSTGYLPEGMAPHDLTVVPVQVVLDGQTLDEGTQISTEQVAEALRRKADLGTSRPAPASFLSAYRRLAEGGADEIVSIHLSGDLSGTYDAAALAARESPIPVHIVDTRTVGMAMGFCVLAADQMRADGASGQEIADEVLRRSLASKTWIVVDSLDQLRRGGRIGNAQALLGSTLMVKPILHVADGLVTPYEKQRTMSRAVARMAEIAIEFASQSPASVAVQHAGAQQRASALVEHLSRALPGQAIHESEVGAVISAHVGLGTVSIAVCPW